MKTLNRFLKSQSGASLVEYSVALIVVVLVGAFIFALGDDVGDVIDAFGSVVVVADLGVVGVA